VGTRPLKYRFVRATTRGESVVGVEVAIVEVAIVEEDGFNITVAKPMSLTQVASCMPSFGSSPAPW
jgi:hypothetical protein